MLEIDSTAGRQCTAAVFCSCFSAVELHHLSVESTGIFYFILFIYRCKKRPAMSGVTNANYVRVT